MTSLAWWLLLTTLTTLAVGILVPVPVLAYLALTILLWFIFEWFLFSFRSKLVVRRVTVEREVTDDRGAVDTLWAGRSFTVKVRVKARSLLGLGYAVIEDWLPFGVDHVEGDRVAEGPVSSEETLELTYRVRCPHPGRVRFEGVRLEMADPQGLFYHVTFVPGVVQYRVLPVLADEAGHTATKKRTNLLPPPGVHRLHRPGSGSELLDLRDYLPGDPPKTIAWKVSARRDRLITKEFESEVPLRCTLFVDISNSVRVGPPGQNALAKLVEITAAVAQANASARDLTGVCLFDEKDRTLIRPARSNRHLSEMLNVLADAAALAPTQGKIDPNLLLPTAYAFAQEVYPDLMRPELNAFPWWLPFLSPKPGWSVRHKSWSSFFYGWLPVIVVLHLLLVGLIGFRLALWAVVLAILQDFPVWLALLPPGGVVLIGIAMVGLWFRKRRRRELHRKRLAAMLAARSGLAPGGLELLLEDEDQLALHIQRFLGEHQVPYTLPLYDEAGRYQLQARGKIDVLSRALLDAVGKGHDNELFVLLVDLLELDGDLEPLLRAVRVALARHHQVIVVCPWMPGLATEPGDASRGLHALLDELTITRLQAAYQRLRLTFARIGVPLIRATDRDPVALILDRLDRLRMVRMRR